LADSIKYPASLRVVELTRPDRLVGVRSRRRWPLQDGPRDPRPACPNLRHATQALRVRTVAHQLSARPDCWKCVSPLGAAAALRRSSAVGVPVGVLIRNTALPFERAWSPGGDGQRPLNDPLTRRRLRRTSNGTARRRGLSKGRRAGRTRAAERKGRPSTALQQSRPTVPARRSSRPSLRGVSLNAS